MSETPYRAALIVGAGPGISAAVARRFSRAGLRIGLASRNPERLAALAAETKAETFGADAADVASVAQLFEDADRRLGEPDVVVYNASGRVRGPIADLDPEDVRHSMSVSAFGAFLTVQQAARRMLRQGRGAILLTGATAGVKGFALSAPFAMGKFALRGLAQSAARELGPRNIHVAHVVVDGAVRSDTRPDHDDATLDPDGIAQTYLDLLRQPRNAWSFEVELRPWMEKF